MLNYAVAKEVEMEKDLIKDISDRANKYKIKALVQEGDKLNKAAVYDSSLPYEVLIVVEDPSKFDQALFDELGEKILGYVKEYEDERVFEYIYKDRIKLIARVRSMEGINENIRKNSLSQIILDKDNIIDPIRVPTDLTQRTKEPSDLEYFNLINEFYSKIYDVGISMMKDEKVRTFYIFEEARRLLLKMAEFNIGAKYDFKVNPGVNGKNMGVYLEKDQYELILNSISEIDDESMWTSIFNACSLFRKLSMEVADKLNFKYLKKTDVEIIKFLRSIWEKTSKVRFSYEGK